MNIEMENQQGYRKFSQEEIDTLNNINETGEAVKDFISAMPEGVDERWLEIARTNYKIMLDISRLSAWKIRDRNARERLSRRKRGAQCDRKTV